jgi:hypothetical protein
MEKLQQIATGTIRRNVKKINKLRLLKKDDAVK